MRISDWSSDVCSSDLPEIGDTWRRCHNSRGPSRCYPYAAVRAAGPHRSKCVPPHRKHLHTDRFSTPRRTGRAPARPMQARSESNTKGRSCRSEEHTSELQSLMRISYAVFCLKKKKNKHTIKACNTL